MDFGPSLSGYILAALASFSLSIAANAAENELQFDHLSWCENNKVMMSNPDGKSSKVIADCDEAQKICTSEQTFTRNKTTFFAYCK